MWDPPAPGIEPVSPALAGRLVTPGLPGEDPGSFATALIAWFFGPLDE